MATAAKLGYGSKLKRSISSVLTDVLEVLSVSGPNLESTQVEVTNFDSTGGYREFIAGLKDGGELTFETNFVKTEYARLLASFNAGTLETWQHLLTDGSKVDFAGVVTGIGKETPIDTQIKNSYTVKLSGAPTFTAAP